MLEEALEQARSGDDYHIVSRVRNILTAVEEDREGVDEMIENELEEVEDHPLIEAILPLKKWIEDDDYHDGAKPAIEKLDAAFQEAKKNDMQNIAVFSGERLLRLRLSVGEDAESTFEEIVDYLESDFEGEDIHLGNFHSLVDLIIEHGDQVDDSLIRRCINVCEERQEVQRNQGNYRSERDTIGKVIQLKQQLDDEVESEQNRLVGSFQDEIDRHSSSTQKAAILKEGVVQCSSFLDEEKERKWKRELREANREAAQNEFAELSLSDEEAEEVAEEAEQNVERIKGWFRSASRNHSSTYMLYCLLKSNGYLPDWETVEDIDSESVISSILPRVMINQEGDPIGQCLVKDE